MSPPFGWSSYHCFGSSDVTGLQHEPRDTDTFGKTFNIDTGTTLVSVAWILNLATNGRLDQIWYNHPIGTKETYSTLAVYSLFSVLPGYPLPKAESCLDSAVVQSPLFVSCCKELHIAFFVWFLTGWQIWWKNLSNIHSRMLYIYTHHHKRSLKHPIIISITHLIHCITIKHHKTDTATM